MRRGDLASASGDPVTLGAVHPVAWWGFGLCVAVALSGATNPILAALVLAALALLVTTAPERPGRSPFVVSLRIGVALVVFRAVVAVAFGARSGGAVLIALPSLHLPSWFAGIAVGGPVTAPLLLQAGEQGLAMAAVLAAFGAASTLVPPATLVRSLPASAYELGLSVAIALTFIPELAASHGAVVAARRLRGRPTSGIAGFLGTVVPVLEGALERSMAMAAAMDARGFGLHRSDPQATRTAAVASLAGATTIVVGTFALLVGGVATWLGVVAVGLGVGAAVTSMRIRSARSLRTRFAVDPFTPASTLVVAMGIVVLVAALACDRWSPSVFQAPAGVAWPSAGLGTLAIVGGILGAFALGIWSAR